MQVCQENGCRVSEKDESLVVRLEGEGGSEGQRQGHQEKVEELTGLARHLRDDQTALCVGV